MSRVLVGPTDFVSLNSGLVGSGQFFSRGSIVAFGKQYLLIEECNSFAQVKKISTLSKTDPEEVAHIIQYAAYSEVSNLHLRPYKVLSLYFKVQLGLVLFFAYYNFRFIE